jgi:hypothetical protein
VPPPPRSGFSPLNTPFRPVFGPFHGVFPLFPFPLFFTIGFPAFPVRCRGSVSETALINTGGSPPQNRKRGAAWGWPSVFIGSGSHAGSGIAVIERCFGRGRATPQGLCLRGFAPAGTFAVQPRRDRCGEWKKGAWNIRGSEASRVSSCRSFTLFHHPVSIPRRGNGPETTLINAGGLPPKSPNKKGRRRRYFPVFYVLFVCRPRAGAGLPSMSVVSGGFLHSGRWAQGGWGSLKMPSGALRGCPPLRGVAEDSVSGAMDTSQKRCLERGGRRANLFASPLMS